MMSGNEKAVVLIGHSHLNRIRDALAAMAPNPTADPAGRFYVHDVWRNNTEYADSAPDGGVMFNPEVLAQFGEVIPAGLPRHYVGVLGGNGHIVLALTRHPRPFDFVLPEQPDLPLEPGAEIVPYEFFVQSLRNWMLPYLWQMEAYRQAVGQTVLVLETPPPVFDDEYVASHLGAYVETSANIVSAALRYKAWRAHSAVLRSFCENNHMEFLPAPQDSLDQHGFLAAPCQGPDATHGNQHYGALVVQQLEKHFGLVFKDVTVFA